LNHVIGTDRASNFATYSNPSLPVTTLLVETISAFMKQKR